MAGFGFTGNLIIKNLKVRGDSRLVILQENEKFEVKCEIAAGKIHETSEIIYQFNE